MCAAATRLMNLPVFLPLQRLVFLLLASSRLVSIHQSGCWLELDLHIIESRCQQRAERCCSSVLSVKAKQGGSACSFGLSCAPRRRRTASSAWLRLLGCGASFLLCPRWISSARCREVIRQHSATGGQSPPPCSPTSWRCVGFL